MTIPAAESVELLVEPVLVRVLVDVLVLEELVEVLVEESVVVAAAVFAESDAAAVGAAVLVRAILVSSAEPFNTRSQLAATGWPRPDWLTKSTMSKFTLLERSGSSKKKGANAAGTEKSSGCKKRTKVYL